MNQVNTKKNISTVDVFSEIVNKHQKKKIIEDMIWMEQQTHTIW